MHTQFINSQSVFECLKFVEMCDHLSSLISLRYTIETLSSYQQISSQDKIDIVDLLTTDAHYLIKENTALYGTGVKHLWQE